MMVEEWASLDKWCTPLMLLLVLNLTILTILLASRSGNDNGKKKLGRSTSMLRRLKDMSSQLPSFNNNIYNYNNATRQVQTVKLLSSSRSAFRHFREAELAAFKHPTIIETETETEMVVTERSMDEVYGQLLQSQGSQMNRTKSDTEPASCALTMKLAKKMKKSASSKSAFMHFKEAEIVEARRPATMKEGKETEYENEEEYEVDSKADDFINMFKQQLKLQRLDSILSYKEMLDRGASR